MPHCKGIHYYFFALGFVVLVFLAVFLKVVFSGHVVVLQTLNLGFFTVRYYGILMALAVLAGYMFARRRVSDYGITLEQADDLIFWLIVGGFIGARLYHIISSGNYYFYHPFQMLEVWKGGLSIYGALFGGLFALWVTKKVLLLKTPFFNLLDWLVPSLVIGQIIGRFGNFFNYELFGYPTQLPWKMYVPNSFRPENYLASGFFHPLFLYEAIGSFIILIITLKYTKRWLPGTLFFTYILLYNCLRFQLEFMRIDSVFFGHVRVNALVSLILVIIAVCGILYIHARKNKPLTAPAIDSI